MDASRLPIFPLVIMSIAVAAILFSLPADATVVFDFFETGLSCQNPNDCSLPTQPFVLAEIILPGPNSSGSAAWSTGFPILPGDPPPTRTGDPFALSVGLWRISSDDLMGPEGFPLGTRDYSISWHATNGVLGITLDVLTVSLVEAHLHESGGRIGSDGLLGGCFNTQCEVTGFWAQPQIVVTPEPRNAPLVLTGLLLFGAFLRRSKE